MKTLCLSLVFILHINYHCAIQIAFNETEKKYFVKIKLIKYIKYMILYFF
jgi:hypothetical protein